MSVKRRTGYNGSFKPMEIYLLRHGIAEEGRAGGRDSDRALTAEGREKLRRVLKRASVAGVRPGVILASPYRRAVDTAQTAAELLEYRGEIVKTQALVPNASPQSAWEEICSRRTEEAILLASHEPLMSSLAAFLLSSPTLQVDMKKGALARIDCEHFGPEPHGLLKWMLTAALS
jgi:phosphohistidine phosphatase